LQGILVAIVLSVVALAHQVANPTVYILGRKPGTNVFRPASDEHPEDESFAGLLLLRVDGRIFFLNGAAIGQTIRSLVEQWHPKVVAIDLSGVFDLEYTALKALIEAEKRMAEQGISLWLVGLTPPVLGMIQRSTLAKSLGRERLHFNLEIAVEKYLGSFPRGPGNSGDSDGALLNVTPAGTGVLT
jgi:MFS superfamily sulfate permease-like transporter